MMTMTDLDALNRAHDGAVKEMNRCAVAIAEAVADGRKPTREEVDAYRVSKLGVESTSRDLEYCMSIVDRKGKDREGKPIKNWIVMLRNFCAAKQEKRSA